MRVLRFLDDAREPISRAALAQAFPAIAGELDALLDVLHETRFVRSE